MKRIEKYKAIFKQLTNEQLEQDLREIYEYLHTDDRCQPISYAEVKEWQELYNLIKIELEERKEVS